METVEYDDWPFVGERRDERMPSFDQSDAASAKRKMIWHSQPDYREYGVSLSVVLS